MGLSAAAAITMACATCTATFLSLYTGAIAIDATACHVDTSVSADGSLANPPQLPQEANSSVAEHPPRRQVWRVAAATYPVLHHDALHTVYGSLGHPGCMGAQSAVKASLRPHNPLVPSFPLPWDNQKYTNRCHGPPRVDIEQYLCYKFSQRPRHELPKRKLKRSDQWGSVRRNGTAGTFLTLRDIVFFQGEFYAHALAAPRTFHFSGYVPFVQRVWPSPRVNTLTVHPGHALTDALRRNAAAAAAGTMANVTLDVAYYQPWFDLHSNYHTFMDTLFPLFHGLLRDLEEGGNPAAGTLARAVMLGPDNYVRTYKNVADRLPTTTWPYVFKSLLGPDIPVIDMSNHRGAPILLRRLLVGHPSECENVEGTDATVAALGAGSDPNIRRAVTHCSHVLWAFRARLLKGFGHPRGDVAVSRTEPPHILFASRRGSRGPSVKLTARQLINADEVMGRLKQHLRDKYGADAKLTIVSFNNISNAVPDLQKATIFVGMHGANLIPSLFTRPNGGVITLQNYIPGFYPYGVMPSWLHWNDVHVNCRMRGKKPLPIDHKLAVCEQRASGVGLCGNWQPWSINARAINELLAAVDDVVARQRDPKRALSWSQ